MVLKVDLEFTAKDASKAVKRRDLIVVIDVLRSCSTIVNLLAEGAKSIIPAGTLREARELRKEHPDHMLFGERQGRKPRGFDFGNSPLEFTAEDVQRKNIIMTTTSGTLAVTRCRSAGSVLLGSFLNAELTAQKALEIARNRKVNISFVLAGDEGSFSLEDFLCAGAIAGRFHGETETLSDKAYAAVLGFERASDNLCENVMGAQHARHLISMGLVRDIDFSCQLNSINIVPVYRNGKIVALR